MTHEHDRNTRRSRFGEALGFTEREELSRRVSDERFQAILQDEGTTVHRVEESYNNYGDWLFVTVSRLAEERRVCVTFYGCGYHEYRERWFTDEWFTYEANSFPDLLERELSKEDVEKLLEERRKAIAPYVRRNTQSRRGQLFEMLAELTDDDGAYVDMEDMGGLADWLSGDPPE